MARISSWIRSRAAIIVLCLFAIQPLLDVLSFWLQEMGISNLISLAVRLLVLGVCVLTAFWISDRKWVYWTAAGLLAALFAGHVVACMQVGSYSPMTDLTNYIRVILMPVTTLCLITFLRQNEDSFEGMQKGLTIALFIMFAVEILATIVGTDHHTYTDGKGIIGWFSNTNSQSSNLTVLLPITVGWQLSRKDKNPKHWVFLFTTLALGFAALYLFCTRLAYLGIFAVSLGFAFSIVLIRLKDWKLSALFLAAGVLFLVLMPKSPMMRHMNNDNAYQDIRQEWITVDLGGEEEYQEILELAEKENNQNQGSDKEGEEGPHVMTEEEHRMLVERLMPVYERHVPDFLEIFGAEETMEMYHYTVDVREFSAIRAKKIMFARMLMKDSPFTSTLFGLDLQRFYVGENIYDVENDFHGIYFLQGAVGLAMLAAFLLYFVALIVQALLKNAKRYFTIEAAGYGIALLMCLAHCYNTAGVLRRPNASVYLSAILAAVYYLVRLRKYEDTPAPARKKRV